MLIGVTDKDFVIYFAINSEYVFVRLPDMPRTGSGDPDPAATRASLISRLQNWEDHGSWQVFFDTYWKLIYSVAIKSGLFEAEARDVVQETIVSVARQLREGGYDPTKSSFKGWLCLITRRRIIDHLRSRTDPNLRHEPAAQEPGSTGTLGRVPDPASLELGQVWEDEWRKNLMDAAIERVKKQVTPKQFQIFDLSTLRGLSVVEVTQLVKVNAAQVYLARHRVGSLVRKEVKRLEAEAEKTEGKV